MSNSAEIQNVLSSLRSEKGLRPSPDLIPVQIHPSVLTKKEIHIAEAVVHTYKFKGGDRTTLRYTCVTDRVNQLAGITANGLTYSVIDISWSAGDGWPTYTTYCPRNDYAGDMAYKNAKIHQIVPIIGNTYFVGCFNPAVISGADGQVYFAVNDDKYDDNRGTFTVEISNIT